MREIPAAQPIQSEPSRLEEMVDKVVVERNEIEGAHFQYLCYSTLKTALKEIAREIRELKG